MTDSKIHIALRIDRLPDGGFVVGEAGGDPSRFYGGPLFASTDIGDALRYIAGRLDPDGAHT